MVRQAANAPHEAGKLQGTSPPLNFQFLKVSYIMYSQVGFFCSQPKKNMENHTCLTQKNFPRHPHLIGGARVFQQ